MASNACRTCKDWPMGLETTVSVSCVKKKSDGVDEGTCKGDWDHCQRRGDSGIMEFGEDTYCSHVTYVWCPADVAMCFTHGPVLCFGSLPNQVTSQFLLPLCVLSSMLSCLWSYHKFFGHQQCWSTSSCCHCWMSQLFGVIRRGVIG